MLELSTAQAGDIREHIVDLLAAELARLPRGEHEALIATVVREASARAATLAWTAAGLDPYVSAMLPQDEGRVSFFRSPFPRE